MSQQESDSAALERRCTEAVRLLMNRYGWQLLDLDVFAERTVHHINTGFASEPTRAAIYTYTQTLYTACSGTEGEVRQNEAYSELFRYLYDIARRRYPDVYEEAAQLAIERTFMMFERCQKPGAFLAFAIQRLMDSARALRRQENTAPQSLDAPIGNDGDTLGEMLTDERQPEPVIRVLTAELRVRFEHLVTSFLQKHPRAVQQIAALRLKYLEDLDDVAISQQLGKSVANVYLLRHRAIEKLREEADWRALGLELGLLPEESA